MLSRSVMAAKYSSLLFLMASFSVAAFSQEREKAQVTQQTIKTATFTLKGGLTFKPGYTVKQGDRGFLKGQVLILKDIASGDRIGRSVTDANGNFEFTDLSGSGANPMAARKVCNENGDCFDFQPLKPDDPGPLKPIDWPDPPLKGGRVGRPVPPLVFGDISCTPQGGGQSSKSKSKMQVLFVKQSPK